MPMSGSASTSSCRRTRAYPPSAIFWDPVLTLTWAAACTSRVGLGTSVLVLPMRHPLPLAKELATLQNLSEGRLILGAGVGWLEDEFEALGVPFRERGRRMDEGIAMMRAVWTDDPVSFAAQAHPGSHRRHAHPAAAGQADPDLDRRHLGAGACTRRAARDGWHGSRCTPEQAAPFVQRLRHAAAGAGIRDIAALRLGRQATTARSAAACSLRRDRGRPRAGRARGPRIHDWLPRSSASPARQRAGMTRKAPRASCERILPRLRELGGHQ